MHSVMEAFRNLNPFESSTEESATEKILREIHVLAAESPLQGQRVERAVVLLKDLERMSKIRIEDPRDVHALKYLIETNEPLYNGMKDFRNLDRFFESIHRPGIPSNLLPDPNSSRVDVERLLKENRDLQQRISALHAQIAQKEREIDTMQMDRVIDMSQSAMFSQIGERIQKEPALNREFNQWLDTLMDLSPVLKEILMRLNESDQTALCKVLAKVEQQEGGLTAFLLKLQEPEAVRPVERFVVLPDGAPEESQRELEALRKNYKELWEEHQKLVAVKAAVDEQRKVLTDRIYKVRAAVHRFVIQAAMEAGDLTLDREVDFMEKSQLCGGFLEEFEILEGIVLKELSQQYTKIEAKYKEFQRAIGKLREERQEADAVIQRTAEKAASEKQALENEKAALREKQKRDLEAKEEEIFTLSQQKQDFVHKLAEMKNRLQAFEQEREALSVKLEQSENGRSILAEIVKESKQKMADTNSKLLQAQELHDSFVIVQDELTYLQEKEDKRKAELKAAHLRIVQLENSLSKLHDMLEARSEDNILLETQRRRLERENAELAEKNAAPPQKSVLEAAMTADYEETLLMRDFINQNPDLKRQFELFALAKK